MLSSFATLLCTSLLASVAVAQTPNANFTQAQVDQVLKEVDPTTLSSWCRAQHSSCGTLCSGNPSVNNCTISQTALNYDCTCASNNSAPMLQFYQPTITFFLCGRILGDCLAQHAGDQASQDNCKQTIVCGNSSVADFKESAPTSSAAAASTSAAATGSSSGSATAATTAASSTPTGAATALRVGQEYGVGILSAGLLAIMAFVL